MAEEIKKPKPALGSFAHLMSPSPQAKPKKKAEKKELKKKPDKLDKPISRSTDQSVGQPTSRPADRSDNKIVDRPKAFYITERLDKKLDEAVRYLKEKHRIKKVDRSAIVNAVMDNSNNWTDESLDKLVDRVVNQLTSRLTG